MAIQPPVEFDFVDRIEVIDAEGRAFLQRYLPGVIVSIHDDGRTMKIFAGERKVGY